MQNSGYQGDMRFAVLGNSLALGMGAYDPRATLAARVVAALERLEPVVLTNLAVAGATIGDVHSRQVPRLPADTDLVLILVGANDVFQGMSAARVTDAYGDLLRAVAAAAPHAKIVACGIPDVAVAPAIPISYRASASALARDLNEAIRTAARRQGNAFVDLFASTAPRAVDVSFFSDDGFHPSAEGYARLAELVIPVVLAVMRAAA